MSTSSVSNSSSSLSPSVGTTSAANGAPLQVTGLASGLDTAKIVSQMMDIQKRPVTALQNQQQKLTARNTQLTAIQQALKKVNDDALALLDPRVYRGTQKATSSEPTRVAASTTAGAGVGGYQVAVTQLANAAQRTFSFASPAADTTITIDGHDTGVAAGASVYDVVDAINNDRSATVYAAATDSGTIVLSDRSTGDTGTGFIQVSGAGGLLAEQAARAKRGQDAIYSVDGVAGSSGSNVIARAIPGVTLTLSGVTTTSGPVTVNVSAPAADASKVETTLKQFITDHNAALSAIQTQLAQKPTSGDPTQGTLYGDNQLKSLLSSMRSLMYTPGAGLPAGLARMTDIGVGTGAPSSGGPTASELAGDLTLNTDTLEAALRSGATAVQKVIGTWANNLATAVNAHSGHGGTIDNRLSGDSRQVAALTRRIATMQSALDDKQNQLTRQFAMLEAALQGNQSTSSWLTSQIAALPGYRRN
ncbi:MAG: flagellar filament capping protein FliD [Solirubrobacteraceae bacterium]